MAGMFDDLIPQPGRSAAGAGRFSDLIPKSRSATSLGRVPDKPPHKPPPPPQQNRTGQVIKETGRLGAVMGGAGYGMVQGAAAGAALGPVGAAAGALAGGALGAAAGQLTFATVEDAIKAFSTGYRRITNPSTVGRVKEAGREAAFEVIGQGVAPLIRPVKTFLTPLLGKVLGVRSPASRDAAKIAARRGIGLGAVDVGGAVAKGYAKIVGIFPFVAGPIERGRNLKEIQLNRAIGDVLNEVAPTATLHNELGIDIAEAAAGAHSKFRKISGELYNLFRESAREATEAGKASIPTANTKKALAAFVEEYDLGRVPVGGGGTIDKQVASGILDDFGRPITKTVSEKVPVRFLEGGTNDTFEDFLHRAMSAPADITYQQHVRLQEQLEGFVNKIGPDAFTVKRVANLKQAMEADLDNIAGELGADLKILKERADTFFANGIAKFRTPTANVLARSNSNMFRAGFDKAGTINEDELLRPVFAADSPQGLRDLRELVGEETFRRAARRHLENGIAKSVVKETRHGAPVEVFDPDALAKNLGLVDGFKDRTAAVEEMLKGTGTTINDLRELASAIHIAKINDPSTFVMRRVTLGGIRGVTGAMGPGAAVVAGAAGAGAVGLVGALTFAAALTFFARQGAKIVATPEALKALTKAFGVTLAEHERRAWFLRAVRLTEATFNPPRGAQTQ